MTRTAVLGALLMLIVSAHTASGHFGGEAFVLVPGNNVDPGQPFEVIVADLSPGSAVALTVNRGGQPVEVGSAVSDTEGHFTTTAMLPADFPHGYFELLATAQDGTLVSTWVLVGPRTTETGSPPVPPTGGGGIDISLIVLGVMVGGSVGAVGYLLLRPSRSAPGRGAPDRRVPRTRARRASARRRVKT